MNLLQHILWVLSEECNEIGQRASKAARFGMDEVQPGQECTNEQRLWTELDDLAGSVEMLMALRRAGGFTREGINAKKTKVEKFLLYSIECGTYQPSEADLNVQPCDFDWPVLSSGASKASAPATQTHG